jgi:hypothetical protein
MAILQEPIVSSWYLNQTGKLMKVKLVLFDNERISRVMVEYLDGTVSIVDIKLWNFLDLDVHARGMELTN